MDNEDTARFELLHPLGKRREMYKNCLKEWELAMSSTRWNPHPFKIEAILTAPGELDFYLEREAFRRAQFASFLHILAEKDMGLWFKFPELLFAPIRLEDEVIEPDKTFVARVIYLEALMLLNERFYDDEWKARIAEYLACRWPGYKGRRITAELLDEWMDWEEAAG